MGSQTVARLKGKAIRAGTCLLRRQPDLGMSVHCLGALAGMGRAASRVARGPGRAAFCAVGGGQERPIPASAVVSVGGCVEGWVYDGASADFAEGLGLRTSLAWLAAEGSWESAEAVRADPGGQVPGGGVQLRVGVAALQGRDGYRGRRPRLGVAPRRWPRGCARQRAPHGQGRGVASRRCRWRRLASSPEMVNDYNASAAEVMTSAE